jgi:hypothetical protein
VDDEFMYTLAAMCKKLEILDISDCYCTLSPPSPLFLSSPLSSTFSSLSFPSHKILCKDVTLDGIEEIAKNLAELNSLSMASTFTSDLHAKVLEEGVCRKLTTLNISGIIKRD